MENPIYCETVFKQQLLFFLRFQISIQTFNKYFFR